MGVCDICGQSYECLCFNGSYFIGGNDSDSTSESESVSSEYAYSTNSSNDNQEPSKTKSKQSKSKSYSDFVEVAKSQNNDDSYMIEQETSIIVSRHDSKSRSEHSKSRSEHSKSRSEHSKSQSSVNKENPYIVEKEPSKLKHESDIIEVTKPNSARTRKNIKEKLNNALNKLIEDQHPESVGNIDNKNIKIDWEEYQDKLILINNKELTFFIC